MSQTFHPETRFALWGVFTTIDFSDSSEPNFVYFEFPDTLNVTFARNFVSSAVVAKLVRIFKLVETPAKKDAASPVS